MGKTPTKTENRTTRLSQNHTNTSPYLTPTTERSKFLMPQRNTTTVSTSNLFDALNSNKNISDENSQDGSDVTVISNASSEKSEN